ncbi:cytochrome P450 2U1-like [Antedon mediterranea]|uniref:cytochrome P450 2U1-like n=1 Tax=Antedon mediterranea TaxID=105859 RepID=UPI003AF4D1A8
MDFSTGSIAFENGPTWNERRRWLFGVINQFCLGKKDLGNRVNLENRINIEADYLCQEMDKPDTSFNPRHYINNAVSNIVCTACFGDRFEYTDPQFKELIKGTRYLFQHTGVSSPGNIVPILYYTPLYKEFRGVVTSMKDFINDIIRKHAETFDSGDIRDIIDAYILESQKHGKDDNSFSQDTLWRAIFDLFNAGTDTTSSTILWIITYLLNYPQIQKKVQHEVDEVLGQEKAPKYSDRLSMPFLEATIMEVQRLSNVIPLFNRATTENVNVHGYNIPAETPVLVNFWNIHLHPDNWERPLNFEPERFLSDDLMTIKKHEAFMPFGIGRRSCIGYLMAKMEIFIFTATLIQRFTFKVPDGEPTPSVKDYVPGLSLVPKPFKIFAIKR